MEDIIVKGCEIKLNFLQFMIIIKLLFRFAELTSSVFLKHSIKVYLMNKVCPTPFVAFGIKQYKCCGGIMVTASHNPKEDNGYKVFWQNGAQVSKF